MCLVRAALADTSMKALTEEIEKGAADPPRVAQVMNGLPRTRKKRRAGGRSTVTLRSSKDETTCRPEESEEEMVRSGVKDW